MREGIIKRDGKEWFIKSPKKNYKLHPIEEYTCNESKEYGVDWEGREVIFYVTRHGEEVYAIIKDFKKNS